MENIKYLAIYVAILLAVWLGGYFVAKAVKGVEVIHPDNSVSCVVVSRMFNTSVDCWKD